MGIFSPPDVEQLRSRGDWPRLIHWSLYDRDPEASRAARDVLRADPAPVVEYLYDTALWTHRHAVGRTKRLPRHGVMLLSEATRALRRVGAPAVYPLVEAVLLYEQYGDPDEDMRYLMLCLVFDVLEKMGRPAVEGLRQLAASPDASVAKPAREALRQLDARGVLEPRPPCAGATGEEARRSA
jgi:hypothetical protein